MTLQMLKKLVLLLGVLGVLSAGCSSTPVRTEHLAYSAFDPVLKPHSPRPYNSLVYSTSLTTLEELGPLARSAQTSIAPLLKPDSVLFLVIPQPPVPCEPERVAGVTRRGSTVKFTLHSESAYAAGCLPTPVTLIALRKASLPSGFFTVQVLDEAGSDGWIQFSEQISTTVSCFDGTRVTDCVYVTSAQMSSANY